MDTSGFSTSFPWPHFLGQGTMSTVLGILVLVTVLYLTWHYMVYGNNQPGPPVYPVVGSLPDVFFNFDRFFDHQTAMLSRSPNMVIRFVYPGQFEFMTANPVHVQHILKDNFDGYPKGEVFIESFKDLLGEGIFTSDGQEWWHQRKVASHEFSTNALRNLAVESARDVISQRLFPILDSAVESKNSVDIQDIMLRLTFDNICRVAFAYDPKSLSPDLPKVKLQESFTRAGVICVIRSFLPFFVWKTMRVFGLGFEGELKTHVTTIREFVQGIIEQRRVDLDDETKAASESCLNDKNSVFGSSAGRSDLLSRLISLGEKEHGQLFSDSFLQDSCISFIFAGRDGTALTVVWLLWLLSQHPEAEAKVVAEVQSIVESRSDGNKATPLAYEELRRMNYTHAALNETLRLYPSVPVDFKTAAADDLLPDGPKVPKGSLVTYVIYAMGRMKQVWGEDACEFKPERWLHDDGQLKVESPFKFVAFNAGPRLCLGKDLAYLTMKLALGSILLKYCIHVVPGHRVEYRTSSALHMKHGLKVTVSQR